MAKKKAKAPETITDSQWFADMAGDLKNAHKDLERYAKKTPARDEVEATLELVDKVKEDLEAFLEEMEDSE